MVMPVWKLWTRLHTNKSRGKSGRNARRPSHDAASEIIVVTHCSRFAGRNDCEDDAVQLDLVASKSPALPVALRRPVSKQVFLFFRTQRVAEDDSVCSDPNAGLE